MEYYLLFPFASGFASLPPFYFILPEERNEYHFHLHFASIVSINLSSCFFLLCLILSLTDV